MNVTDSEKLCRLCFRDSMCHSYIYDRAFGREYLLVDVINELCQLDIVEMDGLPSYLCLLCHAKIVEFKSFKEEAHNVRERLIALKGVIQNGNVQSSDESTSTIKNIIKEECSTNEDEILNDGDNSEESEGEEFEVNFATVKMEPIEYDVEGENENEACFDENQSLEITSDFTRENSQTHRTCSTEEPWNLSEEYAAEQIGRTCVDDEKSREKRGKKNSFVYECTECKKNFQKEYDYWTHMKEHNGDKVYKCTVCGKLYGHKSSLDYHLKSHRGKRPHVCTKCGKNFTKRSHLTSHDRVHTGERPYKCEFCDKAFTQRINMVHHLSTHTNARPFGCTLCSKRFTRKGGLVKHSLLHANESEKESKREDLKNSGSDSGKKL